MEVLAGENNMIAQVVRQKKKEELYYDINHDIVNQLLIFVIHTHSRHTNIIERKWMQV